MAKFVRTLSGEFEDIVYSIEDYFTQNENIKLVDKVFIYFYLFYLYMIKSL